MTNTPKVDDIDIYYLDIAKQISQLSCDPRTKVGAIIVKNSAIISTGYNHLPRGMVPSLHQDKLHNPTKLLYMCHAEENAIMSALQNGISLNQSTLYLTTLQPCINCTRLISQSGIVKVVARIKNKDTIKTNYNKHTDEMINIFTSVGIDYICFEE